MLKSCMLQLPVVTLHGCDQLRRSPAPPLRSLALAAMTMHLCTTTSIHLYRPGWAHFPTSHILPNRGLLIALPTGLRIRYSQHRELCHT